MQISWKAARNCSSGTLLSLEPRAIRKVMVSHFDAKDFHPTVFLTAKSTNGVDCLLLSLSFAGSREPSAGPPSARPPNISLFFFHSPAPNFVLFLSFWGVLSWNFGGVFEGRALKCTRLEFSGYPVKPRRGKTFFWQSTTGASFKGWLQRGATKGGFEGASKGLRRGFESASKGVRRGFRRGFEGASKGRLRRGASKGL